MPTLVSKYFVVERGQLTFYFHQDQSKWNELILDTLNGVSLKETTAKINVNECNVFNMRHKLLVSLKLIIIPNEVEMDEKCTPYNHKGTKIDGMERLLQKDGCLISKYVSSLQYRDLVIQLPEH